MWPLFFENEPFWEIGVKLSDTELVWSTSDLEYADALKGKKNSGQFPVVYQVGEE